MSFTEALCIVAIGVVMVELPAGNRLARPPALMASAATADAPVRIEAPPSVVLRPPDAGRQ